ncbi:MAG: hypothetical protein ACP5KE_05290 [Candidatus Methanodesulfokora sp.]
MKLVEASRTEVHAYVIFGDGQMDERIFSAIASKFDHEITVSNPSLLIKRDFLQPLRL